eukprot:Nk52_evm21s628 gene=Nk52_evmTU21s628
MRGSRSNLHHIVCVGNLYAAPPRQRLIHLLAAGRRRKVPVHHHQKKSSPVFLYPSSQRYLSTSSSSLYVSTEGDSNPLSPNTNNRDDSHHNSGKGSSGGEAASTSSSVSLLKSHSFFMRSFRSLANRLGSAHSRVQGGGGGEEEKKEKVLPGEDVSIDKVSELMKTDTSVAYRLAKKLDPEARAILSHAMLEANNVSFSAKRQFDRADANNDGYITISEFTKWFRHFEEDKSKLNEVVAPTSRQLMRLGLSSGLPFVAFGFFDNFIMLVAGDYIDVTFGVTFGMSTLAAAGLGNMVSDVAGIGIGGVVTSAAARVPFLNPNLARSQLELPIARRVNVSSQCVGIVVGCLLGMCPLYWF